MDEATVKACGGIITGDGARDGARDDTRDSTGGDAMTTRAMTYAELGAALGITQASAKRLALRHKWLKTIGNDGLSRVAVPIEKLEATRDNARGDARDSTGGDTRDDTSVIVSDNKVLLTYLEKENETLKARVEKLEAELTAAREQVSAVKDELMTAREQGAYVRGELAGLTQALRIAEVQTAALEADKARILTSQSSRQGLIVRLLRAVGLDKR